MLGVMPSQYQVAISQGAIDVTGVRGRFNAPPGFRVVAVPKPRADRAEVERAIQRGVLSRDLFITNAVVSTQGEFDESVSRQRALVSQKLSPSTIRALEKQGNITSDFARQLGRLNRERRIQEVSPVFVRNKKIFKVSPVVSSSPAFSRSARLLNVSPSLGSVGVELDKRSNQLFLEGQNLDRRLNRGEVSQSDIDRYNSKVRAFEKEVSSFNNKVAIANARGTTPRVAQTIVASDLLDPAFKELTAEDVFPTGVNIGAVKGKGANLVETTRNLYSLLISNTPLKNRKPQNIVEKDFLNRAKSVSTALGLVFSGFETVGRSVALGSQEVSRVAGGSPESTIISRKLFGTKPKVIKWYFGKPIADFVRSTKNTDLVLITNPLSAVKVAGDRVIVTPRSIGGLGETVFDVALLVSGGKKAVKRDVKIVALDKAKNPIGVIGRIKSFDREIPVFFKDLKIRTIDKIANSIKNIGKIRPRELKAVETRLFLEGQRVSTSIDRGVKGVSQKVTDIVKNVNESAVDAVKPFSRAVKEEVLLTVIDAKRLIVEPIELYARNLDNSRKFFGSKLSRVADGIVRDIRSEIRRLTPTLDRRGDFIRTSRLQRLVDKVKTINPDLKSASKVRDFNFKKRARLEDKLVAQRREQIKQLQLNSKFQFDKLKSNQLKFKGELSKALQLQLDRLIARYGSFLKELKRNVSFKDFSRAPSKDEVLSLIKKDIELSKKARIFNEKISRIVKGFSSLGTVKRVKSSIKRLVKRFNSVKNELEFLAEAIPIKFRSEFDVFKSAKLKSLNKKRDFAVKKIRGSLSTVKEEKELLRLVRGEIEDSEKFLLKLSKEAKRKARLVKLRLERKISKQERRLSGGSKFTKRKSFRKKVVKKVPVKKSKTSVFFERMRAKGKIKSSKQIERARIRDLKERFVSIRQKKINRIREKRRINKARKKRTAVLAKFKREGFNPEKAIKQLREERKRGLKRLGDVAGKKMSRERLASAKDSFLIEMKSIGVRTKKPLELFKSSGKVKARLNAIARKKEFDVLRLRRKIERIDGKKIYPKRVSGAVRRKISKLRKINLNAKKELSDVERKIINAQSQALALSDYLTIKGVGRIDAGKKFNAFKKAISNAENELLSLKAREVDITNRLTSLYRRIDLSKNPAKIRSLRRITGNLELELRNISVNKIPMIEKKITIWTKGKDKLFSTKLVGKFVKPGFKREVIKSIKDKKPFLPSEIVGRGGTVTVTKPGKTVVKAKKDKVVSKPGVSKSRIRVKRVSKIKLEAMGRKKLRKKKLVMERRRNILRDARRSSPRAEDFVRNNRGIVRVLSLVEFRRLDLPSSISQGLAKIASSADVSRVRIIPRVKSSVAEASKLNYIYDVRGKTLDVVAPLSKVGSVVRFAFNTALKSRSALKERTALKSRLKLKTRLRLKPKIPLIPVFGKINFETISKISKAGIPYNVIVRVKGEEVKANKVPLVLSSAFALGHQIVENNPTRSFYVQKTRGKAKDLGLRSIPLNQYRKPKGRTRLKKIAFVEKSKFAINTRGEKKGITSRGIEASIKSSVVRRALSNRIKLVSRKVRRVKRLKRVRGKRVNRLKKRRR